MLSKSNVFWILVILSGFTHPIFALEQAQIRMIASRIYERIAGVPLALNSPVRAEMETLIAAGKMAEAAAKATAEKSFINLTVRNWAPRFFNRESDPSEGLNDAQAMLIGVVRDNRDARELLSGNFTYQGGAGLTGANNAAIPALTPTSNAHYDFLENPANGRSLFDDLVRVEPQSARPVSQNAGILTSRSWAAAHLVAGTNRRAVEYALQQFLCRPIKSLSNTSVSDMFIRRDVERNPGNAPSTFLNNCKGCHGGMDAMGGAFAFLTFDATNKIAYRDTANTVEFQSNGVALKMNRYPGSDVAPPTAPPNSGAVTIDDHWVNLWAQQNVNTDVGWRGALEGYGVRDFGAMLASTRAFSDCMAKTIFTDICHRAPEASDVSDIRSLADAFENSNYNLRIVFERAVALPQCVRQE